MDRRQISIVVIPSNHADIMRNMQVSYPWFPNLKAKCLYVGREKEANGEWCTSSFWAFLWEDSEGSRDVAATGTLRIRGKEWSLEMSRMDGGKDALKLEITYKGKRFENFSRAREKGYGLVTSEI